MTRPRHSPAMIRTRPGDCPHRLAVRSCGGRGSCSRSTLAGTSSTAPRASAPSWNGPCATRISRDTCSPRCVITRRISRLRPSRSATVSQAFSPLREFEPGLDRSVAHAVHGDAARQPGECRRIDGAVHPHPVAANPAMRRQLELARQAAIVGEQQQALAPEVEPADADHPRQGSAAASRTRSAVPRGRDAWSPGPPACGSARVARGRGRRSPGGRAARCRPAARSSPDAKPPRR